MNANSAPPTLSAHPSSPMPHIEVNLRSPADPTTAAAGTIPFKIPNAHRNANRQTKVWVSSQTAQPSFLQGIIRYAKKQNWQLTTDLLQSGNRSESWFGDGVIEYLPEPNLDSQTPGSRNLPRVTASLCDDLASGLKVQADNFAIGRLAAEHLINRNCRNFAWLPYGQDKTNQIRYMGFLSHLRDRGFSCRQFAPPLLETSSAPCRDWILWRQVMIQNLENLEGRTGLFASNDSLAIEVAELAGEIGTRVPEDLAILGVGNQTAECESAPVTLSSINPNLEELGFQAAKLLDEALKDETDISRCIHVSPTGVEARDSTAISNLENQRVAQALVFISNHYPDPGLGVCSVAESLNISRRQLERDFRSEKGCTIREFIEQTRMNEASRLLSECSSLTVSAIADQVGISAQGNFFRIFRKHFGLTPSAYREQQTS
ncbi:substrate-binding domain-containing protein [Pelagicoccus sp. SDUM812002]|uniref:substrate-binding domain-containing protein n=1 Tax=Pelagicoccus sp. SDUM812002 TaxID=3041266 RepID=UPI00280D6FB2|nr:substrate-binding domain-containing protein [Pelagicoccus sp. SDUM812002]MDQ8184334.1 helix-turn-helix domain-containing protein [Pelagicoccus sp. SDUM812002]